MRKNYFIRQIGLGRKQLSDLEIPKHSVLLYTKYTKYTNYMKLIKENKFHSPAPHRAFHGIDFIYVVGEKYRRRRGRRSAPGRFLFLFPVPALVRPVERYRYLYQ